MAKRILTVGLLAVFALACAGLSQAADTCALAENGQPRAVIVLAEKPTRVVQMAAAELATYVKKITGAELPVLGEDALTPEQAAGNLALVGESKRTRELGLTSAGLKRQEHVIRNHGRWLILMGRDEQAFGPVKYGSDFPWPECRLDFPHRVYFKAWGSMYAVDTFLERVCGLRWYLPGEIGEVCPRRPSLVATGLNLKLKPWTKARLGTRPGAWDVFDFYIPGRTPKKRIPRSDMLLWWLRMKMGGEPWQVNHSVYSYYDRFGKEHPEWFADGKPKPRTHVCYLHPGLVEQHAQDARDYFDGKFPTMTFPKGGRVIAAGDYYPAVPIDSSAGWCGCPRCKPVLEISQPIQKDIPGAGFFNGRYSEYVWTFANAVAREVRKTHPDKWISAIAYARYFLPPQNVKLEPNVSVCVTKQALLYANPASKKYFNDALRRWNELAGELYIWEYYLNQYFNAYMAFPWIAPRLIGEDIEFLKTVGVVGKFVELSGWKGMWSNPAEQMLPVYVTFKMLADDSLTADGILEEHYRLFYGPAAEPMKAFFERIERTWHKPEAYQSKARGQRRSWQVMCPPEELTGYHELIKKAQALAVAEPYATRVRLMNEAIYKPMEKHSLAYAERSKSRRRLACPAVKTAPVIDGRLDDAAWKRAGRTEPFVSLTMDKAEVDTVAFVARDDKNLYLAFECMEPNVDKLVAQHNDPDKIDLCLDDDVEVFIDVGRTREKYYHFMINPNANVCDRSVGMGLDNAGVPWNAGATVKTWRGKDRWTVEAAIPLAALKAEAKDGQVWGLNLCRGRRAGIQGRAQNTCWSPTFGGFNNADEFGMLVMTGLEGLAPATTGPAPVVDIAFEDPITGDNKPISTGKGVRTNGKRVVATAVLKRSGKGKAWEPSLRVEGKSGHGYAFTNDAMRHVEVTFPEAMGLANDDFTVMLWYKTTREEPQYLYSSTTTAPLWILTVDKLGTKRLLRFLYATKPPSMVVATDAPPADGTWHHVTVAINRGSRATMFVDGEESSSLAIGAHKGALKNLVNLAGPYHHFEGVLDTFQIYRGALEPAQVKAIYAAQAGK